MVTRPHNNDAPEHRRRFRARYVIGADGTHSTVRRLFDVDFPGKTMLSSIILADVTLAREAGRGAG